MAESNPKNRQPDQLEAAKASLGPGVFEALLKAGQSK